MILSPYLREKHICSPLAPNLFGSTNFPPSSLVYEEENISITQLENNKCLVVQDYRRINKCRKSQLIHLFFLVTKRIQHSIILHLKTGEMHITVGAVSVDSLLQNTQTSKESLKSYMMFSNHPIIYIILAIMFNYE